MPITIHSEKKCAVATRIFYLMLPLGFAVGCGQPVSFGGAALIPGEETQVGDSGTVAKKALVGPESSKAQDGAPGPTTSDPSGQPRSAEIAGSPSAQTPVQEPKQEAKPERSVEAEIADSPMPIAGAFLTCWTDIHPKVGDGAADAKDTTTIGCGVITSKGQKSPVVVPLDQWRIYSRAGVVLDIPIPDIKNASVDAVWSIEFDLPTQDVDLTRIAIKNDPVVVFSGAGKYLITSLRSAKKVGGAINPLYFHLGAGLVVIEGCSSDVIQIMGARPAVRELFVPVSISETNRPQPSATLVVKVAGLCGSNRGTTPPALVVSPRNNPGSLVLSRSLGVGDTTVEISLPPGDYDLVVKATPLGSTDMDNFVMRDFVVVPISSNVTAGGIGARGAKGPSSARSGSGSGSSTRPGTGTGR